MAKPQRKNKKSSLPGFAGDIRDAVVRRVIVALVVILFIAVAAVLVKAFLCRSDYFRLRVVETRAAFLDSRAAGSMNSQLVNLYKGRNVFSIPLKSVSQAIRSAYADVRDVAVRISLPDKLVIDLKLRRPVAFVHNIRYYPIDEDGVVLPPLGTPESMKDLPVIDGIDIRNARKVAPRNLKLALELLSQIRQTRFMAQYPVVSINAADARNMSFYMKNGLEVKIGSDGIRDKLIMLGRTLKDPRLVIDKIQYIDVRFSDVVIGPK